MALHILISPRYQSKTGIIRYFDFIDFFHDRFRACHFFFIRPCGSCARD